jgi:hypothetical protein
MSFKATVCTTLLSLCFFGACGAMAGEPAKPPSKTPEEIEAEKKKKEEEAAKKAADAKKKAEEAKQRAEAARLKKLEAQKKATDFKTWTARNFNDLKQQHEMMCFYLKDPEKNNKEAALFESAEVLGSEEVRAKLIGFTFSKLPTNDKLAASYPPEWLERAKKGAALVLVSGDLERVVIFDVSNLNPKSIMAGADAVRKQQDAKKVMAEEQKKKEEEIRKAKFAEETKKAKEDNIPGLDKTASATKKNDPKTKKPGAKEPLDE